MWQVMLALTSSYRTSRLGPSSLDRYLPDFSRATCNRYRCLQIYFQEGKPPSGVLQNLPWNLELHHWLMMCQLLEASFYCSAHRLFSPVVQRVCYCSAASRAQGHVVKARFNVVDKITFTNEERHHFSQGVKAASGSRVLLYWTENLT